MDDTIDYLNGLVLAERVEPETELDLRLGEAEFLHVVKTSSSTEWLDQFSGTPLYEEAIALAERESDLETNRVRRRIERELKRESEKAEEPETYESDLIDLKKSRLELALHKWRNQDKTAAYLGMCSPSYGRNWLEQFEGTEFFDAAAALREKELEIELRHHELSQPDPEKEQIRKDLWQEQDALRLEKDRLELEYIKSMHSKTASEVQYTGEVNNGDPNPPKWPESSKGMPQRERTVKFYLSKDQVKKDEEKTANCENWLEQFSGTPLFDTALSLREKELELEIERTSLDEDPEKVKRRTALWGQLDQIRNAKSRLELQKIRMQHEGKTAGLSDSSQERGLAKAVTGLAKSKMDPDQKSALSRGLLKAVKKEKAEDDPTPVLGKEAGVLNNLTTTLRSLGGRLGRTTQRQVVGRMATLPPPPMTAAPARMVSRNAPIQNLPKALGKKTIPMGSQQAKELHRAVAEEGVQRSLARAKADPRLSGLANSAQKQVTERRSNPWGWSGDKVQPPPMHVLQRVA